MLAGSSTVRKPEWSCAWLFDAKPRFGERRPVDPFDGDGPKPIVAAGQVDFRPELAAARRSNAKRREATTATSRRF